MRRYDVVVIGGGPAGAAAAILLARAGRTVLVLEKARFPRRKVCGEFIAPAAVARLEALGLGSRLEAACGPEIRRIAVWSGEAAFEAPMPRLRSAAPRARALEREALDTWLLEQALACGAEVRQPALALALQSTSSGVVCRAAARRGAPEFEVEARVAIAAHGSWEPGLLATQPPHLVPAPDDLLAFKAHFTGSALPPGTIVLRPFAGGYAGLVERGGGRVTFACAVRREALERLRSPGLAAGPLRPGLRPLWRKGIFVVGNAAGEAHPVVGEGIALALDSAAALCEPLAAALAGGYSHEAEKKVARAYARAWRGRLARRVWISARFAALAERAPAWSQALLGRAPSLLTLAARLSGK